MEVHGAIGRWSRKKCTGSLFISTVSRQCWRTCSSLSSWLSTRELRFRLRCNCWCHHPLFVGISASVFCSHQSPPRVIGMGDHFAADECRRKRWSTLRQLGLTSLWLDNPFVHLVTPQCMLNLNECHPTIILESTKTNQSNNIWWVTQRSPELWERSYILHPEGTNTKKTFKQGCIRQDIAMTFV